MEEEAVKEDPEKKSILQIRVRFSDLEKDTKDPFMRYWITLSNLEQARLVLRMKKKYSSIQAPTVTRYQETFMKSWILKV